MKKDVILGKAASGEGGSLSVYQDPGSVKTTDEENGYDQLGSHTKLDGSTISIRYNNGTGDSDARGVVLGIAKDSYADPNDSKKTVNSPLGYLYLQDGKNYYYVHGTMANDPKALQGRLVYNSSLTGYNYIANLEDGISFSGDAVKAGSTKTNTTADTRLDPTAANHTLSITGGVTDTTKLTSNNIGVVTTPTEYDGSTLNNGVTKAGGLTIQLAKDLTGITSISSQPTSATTTTGAKIELGTNGTTISGGDVNVSKNKITNLKNGEADTDAATVGQMNTAIGNAKTKYYSVNDENKLSFSNKKLPTVTGLSSNEDNTGAKGMGSLASGFSTEADGVLSTVAGSYSGVINEGKVSYWGLYDVRGTAAVSYGTGNIDKSTAQSGTTSGVANSLIGQVNDVTDSNAAIAIGAGNTISNSYRDVTISLGNVLKYRHDPEKLRKLMQDAVKESGGQVMVMGGGNSVDKAYMTQVVGVGNKVTGHDTTYAEGTSTQYNYVDGFQNTLTNGKNDYIIGANNSVTGDSINKNQSNIVVGDNHTLNNEKNNVVLGSADSSKELAASGAVVIGHNADVSVDNGVALGSDSVASVEEGQKGYDPAATVTNKTTAPWTSTKAAVSVGKADGSVTRQITGVAAGTNDTDAVNVAQIKKLASIDASNIGKNFKDGDVTTNENAWGEALGTGTVTKDNTQLVTGGTVYNEVRPSKDGKYVRMSQTTGDNLLKLDDQVKTNTDKLSDVDSRSVKYDTKTENGKTVVDNAKITLAGEGGTTITNLKAGVNANDAATVEQLDARISGVTYKAGDGIKYGTDADNNKTISVNKGDGLKFTEDHKLAVNTGKHLSVNTDGQIDVGDNGTVAENDGNLVTGDTVYKALNGGMTKMIIGTPGKDGTDGKDGTPGTIGLVGPAGTNGQDGAVDITIQKGEDGKDGTKGANGVDGKNGINRIVYEDKNGKHQVATMEDGLKFAGDDGQKVATKAIAKKLNNTVDIIGGADSTKLTANNIGVNNVDGKLKIQLAKDLTSITSIGNQKTTGEGDSKTTTGARIDLKDDGSISINNGKITDVASGLTGDKYNEVTDKNNAANLSDVSKMINNAAADDGTIGKKLAGKANIDASNIGANLKYKEDGTAVTDNDKKANENLWGQAIGTGTITSDAENGGQQLVTGSTVFSEVRPTTNGAYVKNNKTTGQNLSELDSALQNVDKKAGAHTVLKVEGRSAGTAKDEYNGTNLLLHQDTDNATGQVTYDLKLADKITIGSTDGKKVTIDGTKGEISGLNNTDWSKDKSSDYEKSNKAATEAQVQKAYNEAVKEAETNAANNDIHVEAKDQSVSNDNKISMKLVDKNGKEHGTITISDVAKASDMGNVSDLHDNLKKTDGTTTTVVDAINKVDDKIGDQQYVKQDGKDHTVTNGSTITDAIGALDSAVQNAKAEAGRHSTVSAGDNIKVDHKAGDTDYKVSLKDDISLNSVTAKTMTTDNLTVNKSATIGGVTIENKTISGLNDTTIEKGSTSAVNANTIWKELRPENDGSYIKKDSTTAQNLVSLDTQVKKTSDLINSDGKTIKIGGSDTATKVDVSGKDSSGNSTSRVITGVKTDANDSTSAASVGYVNDMNAANTQQIYHDMNSAYSHVENDISRAAAGSNALAALHPMQEFDPDDKAQYALGYGHYRNSNAGAVGVFYQPDENSLFSLGASFGNGDAGINAGVTFKFGPGGSGHHALTKTQMAKVIDAQSKEIDALKKDNADKDKRIDALEQKVNEILAKVEKDKA
ncbi:YadA-like family protein [Mitsuokella sp.]